jgi:cold shock CspA family protein
MGRSTETFNKKEREKKKLRKQQDKREKSEERKAQAVKGQDLDDMMAYVDENGNLTSTPQIPGKRKAVLAENIQIGIARQEDIPVEIVRTGKITFFNDSKGYGFIKDLQTQESIFVHINGILEQVKENDKVTFEVEQGQKGLNAIKVKKAV